MNDASRLDGPDADTRGQLLGAIRFADTKWLPGDWTKALFVFERCVVYCGGRTAGFVVRSFDEALDPIGTQSASAWYDESLAADEQRPLGEILAEHAENWVVWSADVVDWSLRAGVAASRLRLTLADGTERKVLWGRISNSLAPIRAALESTLKAPSRR